MKRIEVKTQHKSYDVLVGRNIFNKIETDLTKYNNKALLICDRNVYRFHQSKVNRIIHSNKKFHFYLFNPSEKNKNLKSVELIYQHLRQSNFSRKDIVVALGGGITGDVSGFAAATYMRGIPYYQIPTTLLSMVDSSVGGKTGVNFLDHKNLIGAFYQPQKVYADLNFLDTIPQREIISGAGEIFKYAFLADEENYLMIRNKLSEIILQKKFDENLIIRCIQIKASVVEKDEFETSGLRKILNLGHTFAHAFESALNFQIKHGEAVIAGIFASLVVSEKLGLIKNSYLKKYFSDFEFLPFNKKILKADLKKIINFMKSDKKTSDNKIKLVLASKPGNIFIDVHVDEKIIEKSLEELYQFYKTV